MFARTIGIEHTAPAEREIVLTRVQLQSAAQLGFALRVWRCRRNGREVFRQGLVGDLIFDAGAQADEAGRASEQYFHSENNRQKRLHEPQSHRGTERRNEFIQNLYSVSLCLCGSQSWVSRFCRFQKRLKRIKLKCVLTVMPR